MGIEVSSGDGVAEVVIDYPPVNALPVQGWFDLADALMAAGQDTDVRAVDPGRERARVLRRGRHQGDAADRRVRRAGRGEPGVLRGVRGRV